MKGRWVRECPNDGRALVADGDRLVCPDCGYFVESGAMATPKIQSELDGLHARIASLEAALRTVLPHLTEFVEEYPGDGAMEALSLVRAALAYPNAQPETGSVKE